MGADPPAQNPGESTAQTLQGLIQNLPDLVKVVGANILPYEQSMQNAANIIAPQNQQLQADLYSKFAPQLNKVGQDIYNSNVSNTAAADLNALKGPGADLNKEVLRQQEEIDPEFFANRAAAGQKFQELLGGMDPNKLSGSELAQTERGINRLNAQNGANPTASSTLLNAAGTFGNALTNKRSQLLQALDTFQGVQAGSKSGIDAFQTATGKPANNNYGANQLTGSLAGQLGQGTQSLSSNLLGVSQANVSQANDINSQRRDSLDRAAQILGSMPSVSI